MNLFYKVYLLLEEHGPMTLGQMRLVAPKSMQLPKHSGSVARAMRKGERQGYIQINRLSRAIYQYAVTSKPYIGRTYYNRMCCLLANDGCAWVFPTCKLLGQFIGMTGVSVQMALNNGWKLRNERVIELGY